MVYNSLGEYQNALDYHNRSLEMNKRIHKNVNHPDIATSLNNIGVVYFSLREFHKALDYYERSLRMKQVFFDSTNPQIILLQQRIKNLKLLRLVYFVIS